MGFHKTKVRVSKTAKRWEPTKKKNVEQEKLQKERCLNKRGRCAMNIGIESIAKRTVNASKVVQVSLLTSKYRYIAGGVVKRGRAGGGVRNGGGIMGLV